MRNYHVYGIGAALVDTEIEVSDQDLTNMGVEKGVMTLVDEIRQAQLVDHLSDHLVAASRASGGSACNSVIAASYFGGEAYYSCKVSSDEDGVFYLKDLADAQRIRKHILGTYTSEHTLLSTGTEPRPFEQ